MASNLAFKQSVLDLLEDFHGLESLKTLFWTELNYHRAAISLTRQSWPESLRSLLAADPVLFARAGEGGEFHVIYCRLQADRLALGDERQVVTRLLRDHPYALFIFSDVAAHAWHFVNVKIVVHPDASPNPERRKVFRRITVAPDELMRTGAERVALLDLQSIEGADGASALAIQQRHDEAFDVEAVTKEFYRRYRQVFEAVEREITGLDDSAERKRRFTQRLFNRLLFIGFVQKKRWLEFGGQTGGDFLHAVWRAYLGQKAAHPGEDDNFYRDRLLMLFRDVLNRDPELLAVSPDGFVQMLVGTGPYLNGGLFEEDELDRTPGVVVPDDAIYFILHDLLGAFNFTITEASPLEVEVAVDPEMLGKVFEELVTDRHEKGSYYTPKPVVSFMCREALKGYLRKALPHEDEDAVARFVDDHDAAGLRNGESVLQALKEVKACDPACGSGAYLLGMMHELLDLRAALFKTQGLDAKTAYDRKLEIIRDSLYGVDVEDHAVETARLRLWLSLVVDFERGDDGWVPPLPNLEFKIEQGDSLAAPLGDQYRLIDPIVRRKAALEHEHLLARSSRKRVLETEIQAESRELAMWVHGRTRIEGFDWTVNFSTAFMPRPAPVALDGATVPGPAANAPGGFDIVVANPPYLRMELFKEKKATLRRNFPEVHADRADLYVYFYARAVELLAPGGMLVFISPNKWLRAGYGGKLRSHLGEQLTVQSITDFGDLPVFESATAYPMVFVARKEKPGPATPGPWVTEPRSLEPPYPDIRAVVTTQGARLSASAVKGPEWSLSNRFSAGGLTRMRSGSVPLRAYLKGQILYGIKTGRNRAFVIDATTRDRLLREDPNSAEVIRPAAGGRDIRRWRFDPTASWLLYMHHGVDPAAYPAVIEHLRHFRSKLEGRATRQEWYELQQPQRRYETGYGQVKLLVPDIARGPRFALDRTGTYPLNSAYALVSEDLFLLGVLNSRPVAAFYADLSSQVRGGYLRFIHQYIAQIPIPQAAETDRNLIAELAARCVESARSEDRLAGLEAEIDDRVARLYASAGVAGGEYQAA